MQLPVYIFNLKNRTDRKKSILQEFNGKSEFDIHLVEAEKNAVGAMGLWENMVKAVKQGKAKSFELIILCEDDHKFTSQYSAIKLFNCISEAKNKEADVVSAGVSGLTNALRASENLFWVEKFSGTQFIIIFNKFFDTILSTVFYDTDSADYKICSLTEKKFFIFPFLSIQKDFGYSDATLQNNLKNRVSDLFKQSNEKIQILEKVTKFYNEINYFYSDFAGWGKLPIPTYIINLPERIDRREHISKQFLGRPEFDITFITACKHKIGAAGLWLSIRKTVETAIRNGDDVIIICEDDHEFTTEYRKENLFKSIFFGQKVRSSLLSGGTAILKTVIPLNKRIYWVDEYLSTQFIVVFRPFFQNILDEPFDNNIFADRLLSKMTTNKLLMFPFISIQKDFGYSDCTEQNDKQPGRVESFFKNSMCRIKDIQSASILYQPWSYYS